MTRLADSVLSPRARAMVYWVTTVLIAGEMVLGGVWDILRTPYVRSIMEHIGYPSYVLVILGMWKVSGAAALLVPRFPRLKEWAYAGAFFSYTGALASHRAIGDGLQIGLVVIVVVLVASWALRPPSRRLAAS